MQGTFTLGLRSRRDAGENGILPHELLGKCSLSPALTARSVACKSPRHVFVIPLTLQLQDLRHSQHSQMLHMQ